MKNYNSKILIGIGLITAFASCKKQETFPVDKVSIQYVFDPRDSAGHNAQAYLLTIYQIVRNGHNRLSNPGKDYLDAASDDAVSSQTSTNEATTLAKSAFQSVDLPTDEDLYSTTGTFGGANYWVGIRNATEFINNIDVVPVKGFTNGVKTGTIWKSEARFLRAYFYFELVKRYGGVPLLGNKLYAVTDDINVPRSSFQDCINYIVSECDAIKGTLIPGPAANSDNYRVSQGAALALKSRALLYAASPLFNGVSAASSKPFLGYPTADASRWATAATAANDLIATGAYNLDPDFVNVFLNPTLNDPEVIFYRVGDKGTGIESNNAPTGYSSFTGNSNTSPTQELVDAFPMKNGLPITDPNSGYDENNPYVNRDPRFGFTILYNGATWLNATIQTFEGGVNKPNKTAQQTVTGYYECKFFNKDVNVDKPEAHYEDWIIFRYAEILLNYAEAQNEAGGPTSRITGAKYSPVEAIRQLRIRAGIDAGTNNDYNVPDNISKDNMRLLIQNERRIEMAFEEQRYFDIRRWKIAQTVMNAPLHGVIITKTGDTYNYAKETVLTPVFDENKNYLYPIPYAELYKDKAIGQANQNPGW